MYNLLRSIKVSQLELHQSIHKQNIRSKSVSTLPASVQQNEDSSFDRGSEAGAVVETLQAEENCDEGESVAHGSSL